MTAAIVAAESAFWALLALGLGLRYVGRHNRLSLWVLRCVPVVDVLLVAFVAADVAAGAPPNRGHALAAVYLGVTIAFGHSTIAWADRWFRYRFAGGPRPTKRAKGSRAAVRAIWREWLRVVLAVAVAAALILGLIAATASPIPADVATLSTSPYWATLAQMGVITVIWFLAGPAFAGRGHDQESTP